MPTFGYLAYALLILAFQYGHARNRDRTLAKKWKKLPVWWWGPRFHGRKYALYSYFWWTSLLAVFLFAILIKNEFYVGPRTDGELLVVFCAVLFAYNLLYWLNAWLQDRWIRTGKPENIRK